MPRVLPFNIYSVDFAATRSAGAGGLTSRHLVVLYHLQPSSPSSHGEGDIVQMTLFFIVGASRKLTTTPTDAPADHLTTDRDA